MTTTLHNDIRHRRGDSFISKTYAVLIDGDPVDLNEWDIRAQFRESYDVIHEWEGDQVVRGTVTFERDDETITTSTVRLETPGVLTNAWPITVGEFDLQISRGDDVHTIVEGSIRVVRDVTR